MDTITNYKIKSELGQGGMATVYLAEDKKFLSNVAVKVLAKEFAHNENIRKRFLAEARNMFKMSHPNIIKVSDLIEEGDTVAFVMEYIEGDTLKDYLDRKGKLSNDDIKAIFTQILAAVAYVHEQGLIHRDIKPSNFMINPKGQVKLLDFGIAKNTDTNSAEYTQTSTSQQMGTPMYMSPEQVNETKSVTAQSDIYSLGVVLWQMVMGQKPYDTKTLSNFQLQSKIVNEKLVLTNTNWDTSIQKATHKNVDNRYTSAQLFLNDLQKSKSNKVNKTNIEKNDEKTIFENKEEATVIENNKAQDITPKEEKAQPTSNAITSKIDKEKKKPIGVIIAVITGVVLLLVFLFVTNGPSQYEIMERERIAADSIALANSPNASISRIWVDYNKYENGKLGMIVHIDCIVNNLQNNEGSFNCYFYNDNESKLYGSAPYTASDGHIATSKAISIPYEGTSFTDLTLFMPHSELEVRRSGSYKLQASITVNGITYAQSEFIGFTYNI